MNPPRLHFSPGDMITLQVPTHHLGLQIRHELVRTDLSTGRSASVTVLFMGHSPGPPPPRIVKPGDFVRFTFSMNTGQPWEVLAIDGKDAWLKCLDGRRCTAKLDELTWIATVNYG